MQECKFCGSTLPNNAHFCANCGYVVDVLNQGTTVISNSPELDMSTIKSNTPPPVSDPWHPNSFNTPMGQSDMDPNTTLGWSGEVNIPDMQHFHERRTDENQAILPGMLLFAAQMAEEQAPAGNVPVVQGTPPVSGVPAVQGTPAMPAQPAGAQVLYHNTPASAPGAPQAPSWVPHASPAEAPMPHHRRHQTSSKLHTHHLKPHRRHIPRPHGVVQHLVVATVAVVVIAAGAVTGALAVFHPALSLSVNGGITPGGTFQLHGQNFTPGSSVTLTLDQGVPLSAIGPGNGGVASYGAGFANVLQMAVAMVHSQQATTQSTSIPVSIQGTFDVTIHIGQNWPAGVHTIHARDRVLGRSADLQFTMPPSQAKLVVKPSSVLDFGSLETGRKVALSVIVGNSGGQPLHWSADAGSTSWLKVQPASGMVLPGNHEQVVNIVADASNLAAKDYSAVLHIGSDAGDSRITVKLHVIPPGSGSSAKAILNVNPASLDFGTQTVGAQVTMNVSLANTGTQALGWGADTGNASWLKLSSNSGKIQPGGLPQILSVTADTTQLAVGNHSAILNITSNGGNKQVAITVVVTTPPPTPAALSVNPSSLDFGKMDQGTTKTLQETVSNGGGQALTWNLNASSLPGWLSVDTNSGTVQMNNPQTINVTANTANLKPGPYSATLNFTSNGGNASVQVSLFVNTPVPSGKLVVTPNPLDFGAQDPNTTKTLQEMVGNSGGQALTWNLDTTSLPGWLSVGTNSGTVQPGSSQAINVTANTASLKSGVPYSATLNFTSTNGGGSASLTVTLTVNTPPPLLCLKPGTLDFGALDTGGANKTLPEMVCNKGGQPLTWNLDPKSVPGWLSVDMSSGTLQAGSSQTINLNVDTSGMPAGPYSGTLNFTSTNGGGSASLTVTLTVNPRTLTSKQTQSQTVKATGQGTTQGAQATGMLHVENHDTANPLSIKAGTILTNQASPAIHMQIDQDVSLPPTGYTDVPAHVVEVGTIGNLPGPCCGSGPEFQNQCDSSHDCGPQIWDIFNSTAFTGGADQQTYTVVQQSDIDNAANSLKASTNQSALADLNTQLLTNEHLVGSPQCTYNVTSDHAAGDKATTVTVTVVAMCTAKASP
jgi:hypothetical protein